MVRYPVVEEPVLENSVLKDDVLEETPPFLLLRLMWFFPSVYFCPYTIFIVTCVETSRH